MKPGTFIKLPDGRTGTIVWNNLDGYGGIWGLDMTIRAKQLCGFTDEFPEPEFMLRDKSLQGRVGTKKSECVGEEYEII